jgi:hypothetical protein
LTAQDQFCAADLFFVLAIEPRLTEMARLRMGMSGGAWILDE